MTTLETPVPVAAIPPTARAGRRYLWLWALAAVVAAAIIVGLVFQAWLMATAPVVHGSAYGTLGDTRPCDATSVVGDDTVSCREALFVEGAVVGVALTIRNDGPIPKTILAIDSFGRDIATTAVLDAQLLDDETTFGVGEGRPFSPITIEPGAERPVQLVGAFIGCELAAAHYMPGSAVVLTNMDLTVRWLVGEQQMQLPLREVLALRAPEAGACD